MPVRLFGRESALADLSNLPRDPLGSPRCHGCLAIGAVAAGDMPSLRAHLGAVAHLYVEDRHRDAGWFWFTAAALASGEERWPAALRLAGAAEAAVDQGGSPIPDRVRAHVRPWLERARVRVPPRRAEQLEGEGVRLTAAELLDEVLGRGEGDAAPLSPLSRREHEIAGLIGQGLTNGEIAEHLTISKRTVETHVEHIKTKLGFARRARIVAWAISRDPHRPVPCNDGYWVWERPVTVASMRRSVLDDIAHPDSGR